MKSFRMMEGAHTQYVFVSMESNNNKKKTDINLTTRISIYIEFVQMAVIVCHQSGLFHLLCSDKTSI